MLIRVTIGPDQRRLPTPRAITTTEVINAIVDSKPIMIFARLDNGMVSVGLNAEEFVSDTYRYAKTITLPA